jgi:alpha-beta hydrolase superfamily lysophospholipase
LHGIGGHSGQSTYTHLINHLVPLGYALYGLDLRGHGRSQGRRGTINGWEDYRSDLRRLLQLIRGTESSQAVYLLGQSLGGLMVLEFALRYPQEVQGVIASAPALSVPNMSPLLVTLLKLLSPIWPHLVLKPSFDLTGVSRDAAEAQKLMDDPLTDPKLSPRLGVETLSALEWTLAHAADLQTPLLLIHGAADPITPPDGSQTFFNSVSFEDKTLKLYEGGYHHAFIDSNRQQVLADVAEWLQGHS